MKIKLIYYRYFLHKLLDINELYGNVCHCKGGGKEPPERDKNKRRKTTMNEKLANAVKAQANEARLNKKMVLKDLKQLMEGLIQQIEDDRIWISDLKSLQSNLNLAVAQMTEAETKLRMEELFEAFNK